MAFGESERLNKNLFFNLILGFEISNAYSIFKDRRLLKFLASVEGVLVESSLFYRKTKYGLQYPVHE